MSFVAAYSAKSATTSVGITISGGTLAKNDRMFVFVSAYRSAAAVPGAISSSGGTGGAWVTFTGQLTNTYYRTATSQKLCTGDDAATYTFSSTSATAMEAVIIVIRGRNPVVAPAVSNTAYVTSNTTVQAAAVTALIGDDLIWGGKYYIASGTYSLSTPTNFTASANNTQTATNIEILSAFYQLNVAAGTTGAITSTAGSTVTVKHAFLWRTQRGSGVVTTASSVSLTASSAVLKMSHKALTTASSVNLNAASVPTRYLYSLHTTASKGALNTSTAVLSTSGVAVKNLATTASSVSLTASTAVAAMKHTALTTASSVSLTASTAAMKMAHKALTTASTVSLTASNAILLSGHKVYTTASSVSLTASSATMKMAHKALTTASSAQLIAASAALSKSGVSTLGTTASSVSLTASTAVVLRKRSAITTASSVSLTASSTILLRKRSATTTASRVDLTASSAVPRRTRRTLTTASSVQLVASSAVPLRKRGTLTTASSVSLTASSATSKRARKLLSTASSVSLTTSAASVSVVAGSSFHTTASVISLTTATTVTRYAYSAHTTAASVSLTASAAAANKVTLTYIATTASSASLTSSALVLDHVTYTYAPAISAGLTVVTSVLRKNVKDAYPVAASASLTTSTSRMVRKLKTTASSVSLTTSTTIPRRDRSLRPTISTVTLTTSTSPIGWTSGGVPSGKYMTTFAISASLTASTSLMQPKRIITTSSSAAILTASPTGLNRTNSGVPSIKHLTTVESSFQLNATGSLRRDRSVTTSSSGVSLSTRSSMLSQRYHPSGSAMHLELFARDARLGHSRHMFTTSSQASLTTSSVNLWRQIFRRVGPSGPHATLDTGSLTPISVGRTTVVASDTTNQPRQGGVKDESDAN